MPREFMLVTERPSTEDVVRDAAAGMSPAMTVRSVWAGGGVDVIDADGTVAVTVLRSSVVEVAAAAERLVGAQVSVPAFWTEAYATGERPESREVLERIADSLVGRCTELGGNG